jgi:lactate dehydrogenase-like 2-hydroxyacid dehydrogenase
MNESSVLHIEELTELAKFVFTDRMAFQAQLRQEGRNILDILKVGTSAGGAKPKAIIAYNDITGEVRSGQVKALGECVIYDRTAPEEVLERSAGAEVILTNKVIINADHMAALPELKYIGVLATGYNVVDTAAAKERGIVVTNIPSYSTASVAQMVFAHILNITQQVQHHSEEVHKGRWANNKDFCFWDTPVATGSEI